MKSLITGYASKRKCRCTQIKNEKRKMGVTYLTTSSRGKLHVLLNLDLVIDRHGLECARSHGSEVDEEGMPLIGPAKCVVTCAGRLTSIVDKGLVVLSISYAVRRCQQLQLGGHQISVGPIFPNMVTETVGWLSQAIGLPILPPCIHLSQQTAYSRLGQSRRLPTHP